MINPFFFRRFPDGTGKIFVSNILSQWLVLSGEEELHSFVSGTHESSSNQELVSKGFVSEDRFAEKLFLNAAVLNLTKKFSKSLDKPSLVMVVPTLRCDHSCEYCQVSRAPLNSCTHDLEVDPEHLAHAIDSLANKIFKLEFQGGEPLLRQDFIVAIVEELRKLRRNSFDIVIATALGPEISREFLTWSLEQGVSFSISFDGFEDAHRRHRKSALFDSFERVKSQLDYLRSMGFGDKIGFVQTLTSFTVSSPPDRVVSSCDEYGISHLFSRPLAEYGFASTTKKNLSVPTDVLLSYLDGYLDIIIDRWDSNLPFFDHIFEIYLRNLFSPETNNYVDLQSPAGYGLNACIVNYSGHIFGSDEARMLYESTHNDLLPLAKLEGSSIVMNNLNEQSALLSRTFIETNPHCEVCAYQPFCGADPMHHLATQHDDVGLKPSSTFCQFSMGMFDLIVRKFENGKITNNMVSAWLNP